MPACMVDPKEIREWVEVKTKKKVVLVPSIFKKNKENDMNKVNP